VRHEFAALGAVLAADVRELGRASDVLGICVVDDAQVRQVLIESALLSAIPAGGLVLIHSTVHPDTCRAVAEAAAGFGIGVLDAPVSSSGGYLPSERPLTLMVGGDAADFERLLPLLEAVATTVRHVGPLGSGQVTKIVNNLLYYSQKALAVDAVAVARAAGLDIAAAAEIWAASSGASRALDQYRMTGFEGLVPRAAGGVDRSLTVLRKDLALAAELAATGGVDAAAALAMGERLVELLAAEAAPA